MQTTCQAQAHRWCRPCLTPAAARANSSSSSSSSRCRGPVARRRPLPPLQAAKARVPSAEAAVLLESGLPYLDVRTPEEFAEGHAPGAVNVPLMFKAAEGLAPNPDFVAQVRERFPDVTEEIVVGCRSGVRSARACAALEDYGNLIDDAGGWLGWVDAKLPVVRP